MDQRIPPPPPQPMPMPGGQRMMPGPPRQQQQFPQQQQQQQQFHPQQFQGQPQHFQQRPPPIVNDIRFSPDQPINGLAKIHSIVPEKVTTEKDIRKQLTVYEAFCISPTATENAKEVKGSSKRSPFGKDKKPEKKKETWTKALVIQEFLSPDAIVQAIKKLDEPRKGQNVADKLKELGSNQRTQVSEILDAKILSDRDPQFAWEVAQLDRSFHTADNKHGKKTTKSITLYLKRAPKPDVDVMEIIRRREQHKQQVAANAEHQRQMNLIRQEQEARMAQQAGQPQFPQRMGPPPMGRGQGGPPPGGPRGGGGGGGGNGNGPVGVRVVSSDNGSDSSSSSGSDSDSESDVDSDTTPESVSTRPSRSSRHRRADKQYYGRGNSRIRSRSHSRSRTRDKDFLVVGNGRRNGSRPRALPRVPESPRERPGSRPPPLGRRTTYDGHPSVRVHDSRQSEEDFFRVDHTSPRMQPRSILNPPRSEVGIDIIVAAAVQAGLQAGAQAARDDIVSPGALILQRPAASYRDPVLPRPPLAHSFSDFSDRRTREQQLDAEDLLRRDEMMHPRRAARPRSPPRGPLRDYDRTVPRHFRGADLHELYPSAPMSPSLSSGSSGVSYSSREGRNPYGHSDREYDYRRRGDSRVGSHFDGDREEYDFIEREDFIGREEANPFRSIHQGRRQSSRPPSRPPPFRRDSLRSEAYPRERYSHL